MSTTSANQPIPGTETITMKASSQKALDTTTQITASDDAEALKQQGSSEASDADPESANNPLAGASIAADAAAAGDAADESAEDKDGGVNAPNSSTQDDVPRASTLATKIGGIVVSFAMDSSVVSKLAAAVPVVAKFGKIVVVYSSREPMSE